MKIMNMTKNLMTFQVLQIQASKKKYVRKKAYIPNRGEIGLIAFLNL